ncbi:MAG: TrmB family transcriptional regulator [Candidatus Thorarchaeota archaeon]
MKKSPSDALNEFSYKVAKIPDTNWRLHALLKRLGLTKYEIQAYVALVQGGPQTVMEIVKKTGIPQPRAYDTLSSLAKYGLLEQRVESGKDKVRKAKKFRAVEPEQGLDNLFAFFLFAKDQALSDLKKLAKTQIKLHSGIWEVHRKLNIMKTAKSMIQNANYEILTVTTVPVLEELKKDLLAATKRNVTVSCITSLEDGVQARTLLENSNVLRIKQRKGFSMPYIIKDRSQALQWGTKTFGDDFDPEFVVAQLIEQTELIHTLIDHFYFSNWHLGKYATLFFERPSFPRTFVHIQTVIEEVEYLLQRNRAPNVRIYGSYTDTGEKLVIEGRVSKIDHDWSSGVFTIFIMEPNSGKEIPVGGIRAQYEDVTADRITILD